MFESLFEVSGAASLRALSFNVRGLVSRWVEKSIFLSKLFESARPDVILLQETNFEKKHEGLLTVKFSDFFWIFSERGAIGSGLAIGIK